MIDGRETEVVKIGEYDFHFWKEPKGGEVRKLLSILGSAEDFSEESMQSLLLERIYDIGLVICPQALKGEEKHLITIADELNTEDYMEFFTAFSEQFARFLPDKKKEKNSKG